MIMNENTSPAVDEDIDLLNGFDRLGRLGAELAAADLTMLTVGRLRRQLVTVFDYSETGQTQDPALLESWQAIRVALDDVMTAAERHSINVMMGAPAELIENAGFRAEEFSGIGRDAFKTLGGRVEHVTQAALTAGRYLSDGTWSVYREGPFAD